MNVLANGYYMRFEDFVKSYQTFNLKILAFGSRALIRQRGIFIVFLMKTSDIIPQTALTNHMYAL